MATSGSSYTDVAYTTGGSVAVRLQLNWRVNSQNVNNNTSSVHFELYCITYSNGAMYGSASKEWDIVVNGTRVGFGTTTIQQGSNVTRLIGSADATVTHNSAGEGSFTAQATMQFRMNFNGYRGDYTVNLTGTLNTIPRASIVTVSGPLTLGQPMTIYTNRASSSFTHTLTYRFNNGANTGTIATGVGASTTYTPPTSFANYVTGSSSFGFAIICTTYNGGTSLGTTETIVQLSIPSGMGPSFTSSSVTDGEGYLSQYGAFVQNQSSVVVNAVAQGQGGATITGYTASLDGRSVSGSTTPLTLGTPTLTGSRSVTIRATDSRGRSITGTKAITVAAYQAPTLSISAYRYNASTGSEDDESTTIRVSVSGSVYDVNSRGVNTSTVRIQYKRQSVSSFTTANNTGRGQSFNYTYDITGCPNTYAYDVQVTVTDSFGMQAMMAVVVGTAEPILDFKAGGDGLGIFAIADVEGIKMGKPLYFPNESQEIYAANASGTYAKLVDMNYLLMNVNGAVQGDYLDFNDEIRAVTSYGAGTAGDRRVTVLDYLNGVTNLYGEDSLALHYGPDGLGGDFRETLWSGTWSSGYITVPNQMKYNMFIITMREQGDSSDNATKVLAIRENRGGTGSRIAGIGAASTGTSTASRSGQFIMTCHFQSTSSTRWRWQSTACFIHDSYQAGGGHEGETHHIVTKVEGLM